MARVKWTPRRKSIVLSTLMVIIATGAVAYGAAHTAGVVAPFVHGLDWAAERPLTPDHFALAVVVSTLDDDGAIRRAPGAEVILNSVSLFGPFEDDGDRVPSVALAHETTQADGRAIFELAPGEYSIDVMFGSAYAGLLIPLDTNERYAVTLTANGSAYWRTMTHDELETGADGALVLVEVQAAGAAPPSRSNHWQSSPISARLSFFEVRDGVRGALILSGDSLSPPTESGWRLPVGEYDLVVERDGVAAATRLGNLCDTLVSVIWSDPPAFESGCFLTT